MLRLRQNADPIWVPLTNGARLKCRAATTLLVFAARNRAAADVVALGEAGEIVTKAGGRIVGLPDPDDEAGMEAAHRSLFVVALAEMAALDWEGIGDDDGTPLSFEPQYLALLMQQPGAADAFYSGYLRAINEAQEEGNA